MGGMPRSIRIEYPGAFYHVMARGNRREPIYGDDDDRRFFLKTMGEACERTGWKVHAWVLMGNHYHLLLETPEPNLVAGMQWLQNTYTRRFNLRHRLWGRLFGDRYKAVLVEGADYYYETLLDYVHLNPVLAGLIVAGRGQGVLDYPWSSVPGGRQRFCPDVAQRWLATAQALAAFGCLDTVTGRRRWVERLDERARAEAREKCGLPDAGLERDARQSNLRRGWYWGSEAFAERMLEWGAKALRQPRHRSAKASLEKRAHGEMEARRYWLREGLAAAGLSGCGTGPSCPAVKGAKVGDCTARLGADDGGYEMAGCGTASAECGQRQPANPPAPPAPPETTQSNAPLDYSVKKCRLTPISL